MIDIHLHLLPGIDDGAASIDVSRAMLDRARILGFSTLVATPHLPGPLSDDYRRRVESALAEVRRLASALGIDVRLGFEVSLSPDLAARLDAREPITLGGSRTILVDLPFAGWPHHAEQSLFDLQAAGYRPVLAHPERYPDLIADPPRAAALVDRGVILQLTIGSVVGLFGRGAQRCSEELLSRNLVDVVASDAHSAGQRYQVVERGLQRLEALLGPARLRQLVADNPAALLADAPLPPAAVSKRDQSPAAKSLATRLAGLFKRSA